MVNRFLDRKICGLSLCCFAVGAIRQDSSILD